MTLVATLGMVLLASATAAADATDPTVTGVPEVGAQLTATPVDSGDEIDWETCDDAGTQIGSSYLATNTTTYTLAASDEGTYVCAVEQSSSGPLTSDPFGPVGSGPTLSTSGSVQQGELLTVSPGAYSSEDAWEDCDSAGTNCQPVATGATGPSYTVARSDADYTIEVQETATYDGASSLLMTAPTGLVTARAPNNTGAPTVSGTPQVGQTLTASIGSWSNDPTTYAYSWERCSAGMCVAIPNATGPTYVVSAADVGSVLEVFVTASVFSSAGPPYPSFPIGPVVAATTTTTTPVTVPPPTKRNRTSKRPLGHLTATMQWTFRYTPSYTQILALGVHGAAIGSTVTVRCSGKGCPFPRRSTVTRSRRCGSTSKHACRTPKTVDLAPSFRGRDLRIGARITVTITRRRYVGRYYRFVVRARKQPMVRISCLAPGSNKPGNACTSS